MKLLIGILFLFTTWHGFAQVDSLVVAADHTPLQVQEITESELEPYLEDSDFDYTETPTEIPFWDDLMIWFRNLLLKILEAIFGVEKASGIFSMILKALPYLLLVVLVYLLIKLFLKFNTKTLVTGKKLEGSISLTLEEELIKKADLENLILDALKEKQFRLALRYQYLLTLKRLTEKELINWQPDKTNTDYIWELHNSDLKTSFTNLTRIYDYVWYGSFLINEEKYFKYQTVFQDFNQTIQAA